MLVQVAVLGCSRQGDALLGHEDASTNVLTAHLDRPALIGSHQESQHLIERDKTKISRKSHLNYSLA